MPRAMWSGAISFGLVNIPVKLFKATKSSSGRGVSFHQIHKTCGTRIRHLRWCPKDEVEVPWDEVVKGYEVEKGKYVEVDKEELDELLPDEDQALVAIENFVAIDEVDPIYYDAAYYMSPDGSPKAYALLFETLQSTGKVAVARVMLRTRSHLALVRTFEDHLLLETMFYERELADVSEVPGVSKGKAAHVDKRQVEVARQLVESMSTAWEPERYKDDYAERVKELIQKKVEGGEVVESLAPPAEGGKVVDLLDALKRSVAATKLEPVARTGGSRRIRSAERRRSGGRRRSRARHG